MTIVLINNYFEKKYLHRVNKIADALRKSERNSYRILHIFDLGQKGIPAETKAVILSGSSASFVHPKANQPDYSAEIELVKKIKVPILGICFGHQLIGRAFSSRLQSLASRVSDLEKVEVVEPNEIFSSWKKGTRIILDQNHKDYLADFPHDFALLAKSKTCKIEAMKHVSKPIYGVQAHIERATKENPDGWQVLQNFISNAVDTGEASVRKRV